MNWYIKNSKFQSGKGRILPKEKVAFVSTGSVLSKAAKQIQKSVGLLIGGWFTLFEHFKANLKPFTTTSGLALAKSRGVSTTTEDIKNGTVTAVNAGNKDKHLEEYMRSAIDNDLPSAMEYYEKKQRFVLEKQLQKKFNYDRRAAKDIAAEIHINL